MTTLEKIRAEIAENQKVISETLSFDKENEFYNGKWAGFELALAIIDKYAEQEKLMIIEANVNGYTQGLKDSSKAEQEPCDDVVSRQAVLDVIYGQHIGGKETVEHGLRNTYAGDLREIADEIIALPSVRPQEQIGHWDKSCRCSECGYGIVETEKLSGKYKFCPSCGADMRVKAVEK